MYFVLIKTDIINDKIEIMCISSDISECIKYIHEYIGDINTDDYVIYLKQNNRVEQYKKAEGYLFNSNNLEYVYSIVKYDYEIL